MAAFVSADTMAAPFLARNLPRIVHSHPTGVLGESSPREQARESKQYWAEPDTAADRPNQRCGAAVEVLAAFDALPPAEQQQVAAEILRRSGGTGDLPDAALDELA